MRLGFLGTGSITEALVTGLHAADVSGLHILLSPRNAAVAARLAETYPSVRIAPTNQAVLDGSDIIFLAVRPQVCGEIISQLIFRLDQRVISLVATLSLEQIIEMTAPATSVTRAIPLPSAATCQSATVIYPQDPVAANIFTMLGTPYEVASESEFEALCAATATASTYFAFAETITTWMVEHGVEADKARDFYRHILTGLANDAASAKPGWSFASLAAEHATPGGLNEQVASHLKQFGIPVELRRALDLVLERTIFG